MKQPLAVEHFQFEQDFMEDNIRCIPMIVRFKLDACKIKLKLKAWSKMTVDEREQLTLLPINTSIDISIYNNYLKRLILQHTGEDAIELPEGTKSNGGTDTQVLPSELTEKLKESGMRISPEQWKNLSVLQRFALLKLSRPGHENKNFPKAMKEFGLA